MHGKPWFVRGTKAPLDVSSGSPTFSKPIIFGIDGPKISRSKIPIRGADLFEEVDAKDKARLTESESR